MAGRDTHTPHDDGETWSPSSGAAALKHGRFGRFRLESSLGRGGMGQVFSAWDPRLERRVAIKLVRDGEPRLLARFAREARAQASLRHPGICPVFEVGEADGAPFIVMQKLDGRPLDEATEGLPLETKLELVRRVAEAVHAAHRAGLIHRDLKPANVLVEEPEEGLPHPYVVDFGLARPLAPDELGEVMTEEGAVLGTPSYMAPEQVRGELDALDRRTDVYALGATLYRLVAGRPPFRGGGVAFMLDVLENDPPRLSGVPAEVELIIFKCLEKDPDRRYASAKDLAEDLRRYLDGETVLARPVSRAYRLAKWVRRHRALAAALVALVLVLLGSVLWALYAAQRARERERLVVSFVEQVEEMQAEVRYSHMAPLHDTRPDRILLRERMARIREQMARHGALAAGAGHYALGSGYLALEELEAARREFEAAWAAGHQTPETAAGLAQALSAIFRERLSDLELVRDWTARQRRRQELERLYGEPARAYLGRRLAATKAAGPLLTALSHYHHGRFARAIETLGPSAGALPWSYELPRLEGEIRRVWAIELNAEGDSAAAERQLASALEALERAAAVAESDPSTHRTMAQVIFQRASYGASEREVSAELVEPGLAAVGRALVANSDDARAWLWKARLHRLVAKSRQNRGEDPTGPLEVAVQGARRAASLSPTAPAWRELARAHWGLARWSESRGQDPRPSLEQASAALAEVPSADRDYYDENLVAMIRQTRAGFLARRGEDAAADYEAAVAAYRAAIALHTAPYGAWINLGTCALARAQTRRGDARRGDARRGDARRGDARRGDALQWLGEAVEAFERAQEIRPQHGLPSYSLGRAYLRLAQGGDPASGLLDPALAEQALVAYRRALELSPTMFLAHNGLGEVYHHQALAAAERGEDPGELFDRAREEYRFALEMAPEIGVVRLNLAWTDYFEAKLRIRAGGEPGPALGRAREASRSVFEAVGDPWALLCLASTHRLEAEWRLDIADDARTRASIVEARRRLEQLLELRPRHAEGLRSLGRLETLEARRLRTAGQDPTPALESARRWLEEALEQAPEIADFHLALARLELEEGGSEACARGREAVDHALERRPGWAAAEAVERRLEDASCARSAQVSGSTTISTCCVPPPWPTFETADLSLAGTGWSATENLTSFGV